MITSRQSGATQRNPTIESTSGDGSNTAWLASLPAEVAQPGAVLLLGGANVLDFRLRVAQSHLRRDLLPSFWSQTGILVSADSWLTVPLDERLDPTRVPSANAVHQCSLADYDDPVRYPNIAVVTFAEPGGPIVDHANRLKGQRSAVDLPQLVVAWLAFVWGAGSAGNPLLASHGLPSAALVETAFGMAGIELSPGTASATSCPEAIWQAALWWHEYYEKTASATVAGASRTAVRRGAEPARAETVVPFGAYATRQPAAAVVETTGAPPAKPRGDAGHTVAASGKKATAARRPTAAKKRPRTGSRRRSSQR